MLITKTETDALWEAMRSVLGEGRAMQLFLEMWENVSLGPEAEMPQEVEQLEQASMLIGEAHDPPPARPRSVEPEATGASLGLHSGVEGREA